ncbi:class II lanthipeptide, LchA2/BrtA2 family [Mangrovibacillus sp. Mu-81]|jgi:hypothetical protein|uniref:class II lanthipeptide, LchA2/BrtA2 family n=1 Tax=Mangrovibacillus sp. Mu-81 TaxID=3121478 RepID=UPI002FE4C2EC
MKNSLEKIGMVDEKELMELSGATDVEQRTTWACATFGATVAITIYTVDRSYESCPTTSCSSRC